MILSLFKSNPDDSIPNRLYGGVVAISRDPALFEVMGVPDTVMGRFDMLALHAYLFARRMKMQATPLATALSQDVFDLFVADVERALREIGIGDQTVPKRKKRMIHSYYGQIEDFDKALDDGELKALLPAVRNRYLAENAAPGAETGLADYLLSADRHLSQTDWEDIRRGNLKWMKPDA